MRRAEVLNVEQLQRMLDDSPVRAAQAILIAAKEGVVDAQALLGQILLQGRGIARDEALALRWFRIAAQGGHLMARNMVARCLEHGWGCPADAVAAAQQYRLAAEAELDWAQYNYANLLATGRGVAEDQPQALRLYRLAAEQGHAKSMNLLGRYLEDGLYCPRTRRPPWTGIAAQPTAGISVGSSVMRRCWRIEARSRRRWSGCTKRLPAAI